MPRWTLAAGAMALTSSAAFTQPNLAPYCPDLQSVVRLAASPEKFSSITGDIREGSFRETTMPLAGWKDCTVYGEKTYACNSEDIEAAEAAQERLADVVRQVKACFGDGWWTEDSLRSSPLYVVLHHPIDLATMTISTDEERKNAHVLRLIMFLRN